MLKRVPRTFASSQPGSEIARAHLRIGLEAAAGEHHGAGADRHRRAADFRHDAVQRVRFRGAARWRASRRGSDAAPLHIGIERLEQLRAAAPDVQRKAAPELELAVDLDRPGARGPAAASRPAAPPTLPCRGCRAPGFPRDRDRSGIASARTGRRRTAPACRCRSRCSVEIFLRQRRQHRDEIVDAAKREAERAAGEMRVAAALLERSGLQHQHPRAVLVRRDRGAQRGVAGPDHENVGRPARQCGGCHRFPPRRVRPVGRHALDSAEWRCPGRARMAIKSSARSTHGISSP